MNTGDCGPGSVLNVLLVDDDPNDLALFGIAVQKADVHIWLQTATGAEQAIEYLEGKGVYGDRAMHPLPNVVVVDLIMPGMDGFGFLAWQKGSPALAELQVIVLSGLGDQRQIERAVALGADGCLPKPAAFDGWTELVLAVWNLGTRHNR